MDDEIDVCVVDKKVEPVLRKEERDADDKTSEEEEGEMEETELKRNYPLDRASKEKKRAILDSRLMLSSDVYKVLLEFLRSRKKKKLKRQSLADWCIRLRESGMKGSLTFLNRVLRSCQHKLDIKYFQGKFFLYHKISGRLIAAKDHMPRIIMEAHTGTGLFQDYSKVADNGTNEHHSLTKTITLLQNLFTMGDKGFGFSRDHIEECILACSSCCLAPGDSDATRAGARSIESRLQDVPCDQTLLTLKDLPLSMAVCGPSKNSVWYDQQGLAEEKVLFMKLIGVITEIGIEVQKTVQGDPVAKERLLTKICCGEKLIHDMKARTKITLESGCLSMAQFLDSYTELESEYRDIGRLDLFIYDMNLLLFLYKFSSPDTLMEKINSCVQALRAKKKCNLKFYA